MKNAIITDVNVIAQDAGLAGYERRLSPDMPSIYADTGDNAQVWRDNWETNYADSLAEEREFIAEARQGYNTSSDATGQDDPYDRI